MTKDAQLTLIDTPRSRRMDRHTREVGRAGVAQAREALRAGRSARTTDPPGGATPAAKRAATRRPGQRGGGPRRAAA
jgi:hypothetical protein